MNSKSINLLIPETNNTSLLKRIEVLRFIALGGLAIIVVSAVSLFFMILSSPLPTLRAQENASVQKLTELRTKSTKLYLVRERLGTISTILNQRPVFDQLLQTIQANLPEGVAVDSMKIDRSTLTLTVSSTSLATINSFITAMQQLQESDKTFTSLTLSEVHYDEETPYFSVTIKSPLTL